MFGSFSLPATCYYDVNVQQVYTLESEVADLQASSEVTNTAVQSLEATLAAIERAEARRASQAPPTAAPRRSRTPPGRASGPVGRPSAAVQPGASKPPAGSRRGSRDTSIAVEQQQQLVAPTSGSSDDNGVDAAVDASGSVAVLSRELVKAQMAAADAQRKLRVGAR